MADLVKHLPISSANILVVKQAVFTGENTWDYKSKIYTFIVDITGHTFN